MKYIFELVLTTIIIFFVWNILKKLFFSAFQNKVRQNAPNQDMTKEKTKNNLDSQLKWDAETIEYEEVKEKKTDSEDKNSRN